MSIYIDIEKQIGKFHLKVKLVGENETIALLGASGCGKTMTLKCIAGIETPDKGIIILDGIILFDSKRKINLPSQKRNVGYMFQNYALFPNMNVYQNVEAGAHKEKDKKNRKRMIQQILQRFGLEAYAQHYPHQLSGGQQQRVALARILISNPNILLLDEPFSALDSHMRFHLEQEVRSVLQSFKKTVIMVSHDRNEVYHMADQIAIMNQGLIEICDLKKIIFQSPKTVNGAILTGCKNISEIRKVSHNTIYAVDWNIKIEVPQYQEHLKYIGIRMHDIIFDHSQTGYLCRVEEVIENPFSITVMLRCNDNSKALLGWELDKAKWAQYQKLPLWIKLPQDKIMLLEGE